MRMTAKQLRKIDTIPTTCKSPLYIVVDRVYDTYNVGGLFRLADALSASHIHLCGDMETPPNKKIKVGSCGTYKITPWTHSPTAIDAIADLRHRVPGIHVAAVEQTPTSVSFKRAKYKFPLAIIVGNESDGISLETLQKVDQ